MGIEPTEPFSRKDPTGFEDQAEHQLGCTPMWGWAASAAARVSSSPHSPESTVSIMEQRHRRPPLHRSPHVSMGQRAKAARRRPAHRPVRPDERARPCSRGASPLRPTALLAIATAAAADCYLICGAARSRASLLKVGTCACFAAAKRSSSTRMAALSCAATSR